MLKGGTLISVVMPAYNASAFIGEAIQSVQNQTHENWELIVVDDGSTDDTKLIAQSYAEKDNRISVYHQANQGGGAARNEALKHISGDYVQYLDADDVLDKEKFATHLKEIQRCDYLSDTLTYGTCIRLLVSGECVPSSMKQLYADYVPALEAQVAIWNGHFNSFQYSSYLIPRMLVEKAGKWNEVLYRSQDSEYMARVLAIAKSLVHIPAARFYYRQVNDSVSSRKISSKQLASEAVVCDIVSTLLLNGKIVQQPAKHACEVHYTDVLTTWYPQNRFLVKDMLFVMKAKGLHLNFENRGKTFHILNKCLGWRMAVLIMRLKNKLL